MKSIEVWTADYPVGPGPGLSGWTRTTITRPYIAGSIPQDWDHPERNFESPEDALDIEADLVSGRGVLSGYGKIQDEADLAVPLG